LLAVISGGQLLTQEPSVIVKDPAGQVVAPIDTKGNSNRPRARRIILVLLWLQFKYTCGITGNEEPDRKTEYEERPG
jgi:hypothetical protein